MKSLPDSSNHDRQREVEGIGHLQPDDAQPQGQRTHGRFRWRGRMEVAWLTESGFEETRIVESLDLGLGGMGIASQDERAVGDVGAALVLDSGEAGALRFFEVVHCRRDRTLGCYIVGAQWTSCSAWANSICVRNTAHGLRLRVRPDSRASGAQDDEREVA